MNIRNFWIEGEMDGLATRIATGPPARDGGFRLTIYMRREGSVTEALRVRGHAQPDGGLTLEVAPLIPGDAPGMRPFTIGAER